MSSKQAFICRPTGTLGTAVTKALLRAGYTIHALVLDVDHERTRAYQSLSPEHIKLFEGDINKNALSGDAMKGCNVLFLNVMPDFTDLDAERNQGKAIIEAAQTVGVQHIVYVSLLGLDILMDSQTTSRTSISGAAIMGKAVLEEAVQASGIKHCTVLRPGYFMANFLPPFNTFYWPGLVKDSRAESSYAPDTILNLTDPQDVAAFTVAAFEDPNKFHGKNVSLLSQRLEVEEAIEELRKISGRKIESAYRSEAESKALMAKVPLIIAQLFLRDSDALRNIEEPKRWGISLGSFAEFLDREKDVVRCMFEEIA